MAYESLQVIVSYYSERPAAPLQRLLGQLTMAGVSPLVVVNQARSVAWRSLTELRKCRVVERANTGMNIGAWLHGIRLIRAKAYVCLQDECFMQTSQALKAYENLIQQYPRVGLWGETLNTRWAHPWKALTEEGHSAADAELRSRAALYARKLAHYGLPMATTAVHLRSLVWGFDQQTAALLQQLPDGHTKHDCIALEIGASQLVMSKGRKIAQTAREPFTYFGHSEWRRDGLSKEPSYAA